MTLVKSHFLQWNTTLYNFALFSCIAMKCGDCVVGKNCYSVSFDVQLSVFVCIYNFAHCNDDVRGILEPLCAILLGSCPVQSVCVRRRRSGSWLQKQQWNYENMDKECCFSWHPLYFPIILSLSVIGNTCVTVGWPDTLLPSTSSWVLSSSRSNQFWVLPCYQLQLPISHEAESCAVRYLRSDCLYLNYPLISD